MKKGHVAGSFHCQKPLILGLQYNPPAGLNLSRGALFSVLAYSPTPKRPSGDASPRWGLG
jgi:hypothetical protein